MKRICGPFITVLSILLGVVVFPAGVLASPQEVVVPITNPGFEQLGPSGDVVGWRLDEEASSAGVAVTGVTDVFRSGPGSLRVGNAAPAVAVVESEPVSLQVGHLYRLGGWIRTAEAISDPMSRYPTAVAACLSMASFPFTNHSPSVGADSPWTRVEVLFIATRSADRIHLHLGHNGTASGTAWFDDLTLEKVTDIAEYIPLETVRWSGPGYRYDDRGWIFVHVEGAPYERGYQYGSLVADEIVEYMRKLGVRHDEHDPVAGWDHVRFLTDAIMLRRYDDEYLTEMKGIADGARSAGAELDEREVDLIDIVALNSVVDLGQMRRSMRVTPHSLTGQSFLAAEEEMKIALEDHKCSAFVATGPATADGEVVFGQIFMWGGYTGVHWNVICDLVPEDGHRLVYQTFPGGIHSGADFYINAAGIVIGETTVSQTPYAADGTPQSNRIRKAAQYADTIDDVVRILWEGNNGMYTNDWPIADVTTGEVAIFLLGTKQRKLWRTSEDMAPFGLPGFLWANNNNRDPAVRREYVAQPEDAPFDLMFAPWNRDVAFNEFYREHGGEIDAIAGVNLWASSPVNRAHACDGKITTSEMASELIFLAHHGKVTLREKFPGRSGRNLRDLPGAEPHLSLGYSVVSPIWVTERLQAARRGGAAAGTGDDGGEATLDAGEVSDLFVVDPKLLWRRTMYPVSDAESWLISGSAAYWRMLRDLGDETEDNVDSLHHALAELNARYLYTVSREGDLAPAQARRAYDRYGPYVIPRIKGTIALHQLRLLLGTETFLEMMRTVHERFAETEVTTAAFIRAAEDVAGRPLEGFVRQWIDREGLPQLEPRARIKKGKRGGWDLHLSVEQTGDLYHVVTFVAVETGGGRHVRRVEVASGRETVLHFSDRPQRLVFNPFHDVPVVHERFYTWRNFIDDFDDTLIVYGTSRQIEANHTMALRWQETVADAYVEILPPLVKDSELTAEQASTHDLMVLGSLADTGLLTCLGDDLPVRLGKNFFAWNGVTYADPRDGLMLVLPNPYNPQRVLYLMISNSAMELYQMTRRYHRDIPSWAVFRNDEVVTRGYHQVESSAIDVAR